MSGFRPTSAKRVTVEDRRDLVMGYLRQEKTQEQIVELLKAEHGISVARTTITNDVKARMNVRLGEAAVSGQEVADYREQQRGRYEALIVANWQGAISGDPVAAGVVMKAMDGENKLLGLNAPTKVAATDKDGNDAPPPNVFAAILARFEQVVEAPVIHANGNGHNGHRELPE